MFTLFSKQILNSFIMKYCKHNIFFYVQPSKIKYYTIIESIKKI